MAVTDASVPAELAMVAELADAFASLVRRLNGTDGELSVNTVAGALRDLFPAAGYVDLVDRRNGHLHAHPQGMRSAGTS